MANLTYVTLVPYGGTPVHLADQTGAPFATTGTGALVFANGATLENVQITAGSGGTTLNSLTVNGDITYTGALHGAFASPLTTRGDVYVYGASGNTRLGLGASGFVLGSNGTDALWVVAGAGSVTEVDTGTGLTGGPVTTSGTISLANTAVTPASYGDATHSGQFTVDQQGRLTAAASVAITPAVGSITGLGTGVATALAVNVGSAGAPVTFNGAGGTPSSLTLTNATGLPIAGTTGYGTGVATALAINTPGAGSVVVDGGTPAGLVLTNATGLPAAQLLSGTLVNGVAATTQGANDNSTKLATTAYDDRAIAAQKVVVQVFVATGTYTPTANMIYCTIECWGGGGGGGGTAGTTSPAAAGGGGGGAGSYSRLTASAATIGASKAVTIGTAGTAGTAGNNAGGAAGDSSVGSLCVGKGGSGGGGNAGTGGSLASGGLGGVAGTGDITSTGAAGISCVAATVFIISGGGGSSLVGGGAVGISAAASTATTGSAASGHASGGGGGISIGTAGAAAGGAGTAGYVVITEYCTH